MFGNIRWWNITINIVHIVRLNFTGIEKSSYTKVIESMAPFDEAVIIFHYDKHCLLLSLVTNIIAKIFPLMYTFRKERCLENVCLTGERTEGQEYKEELQANEYRKSALIPGPHL